MGRKLSHERCQGLTAYWTRQLDDVPWQSVSRSERLVRLASLVGLETADLTVVARSRLTLALGELLEVLADTSADRVPRLESWIERRLIARSPELLLTLPRRAAILATLRDRNRRGSRAQVGIHATRIELPQSTWAKLVSSRRQLGLTTLNETLAQVIDAYALSAGPRPTGKGEAAMPRLAATPDLFEPLDAPSKPLKRR